jgi:hypothetical protein
MIDALFAFWFSTGMMVILAVMLGAMMEHQLESDPKESILHDTTGKLKRNGIK